METDQTQKEGTAGQKSLRQRSFRSIQPALSEGVLKYLDSKGFHSMTPVQEAAIPLFLENKDVAVQAETGSGKTLSFLIPLVERLRKTSFAKNQIGGLVLSPTRELALQTWRVCCELCEMLNMATPLLLVGGGCSGGASSNYRPVTEDLKTFKRVGCDIAIGTPGRLEDVLTRYNVIDVSELEILIMDEADVLLLGKTSIDPKIASILSKLPRMRRTGIFSATTTFTSDKNVAPLLQRAGMRNPVLINVEVSMTNKLVEACAAPEDQKVSRTYTPAGLTNFYLVTKLQEKISRLVSFLIEHKSEKIIVFFLTCACVDFFGGALLNILNNEDIYVEILHGKLAQKRREKAMERFRSSRTGGMLFCTDVAARGLDVDDIDWVVQVDAPQSPSQFVHRVGRAARAGKKGSSLLFLSEKEEAYVDLLANRQVQLAPLPVSQMCQKPVSSKMLPEARIFSSSSNTIPNILPTIKEMVKADRDMLEKGTKAFTSFIRAYKEHVCAFIFRFGSLDLGHLATSFCLLRLPKMPELRDKNGKLKNFVPAGSEVDIFAIPYLDKRRQASREKRLVKECAGTFKKADPAKAKDHSITQSPKKWTSTEAKKKGKHTLRRKRGRHQQIVEEWDALAREERLFKKLRRGKISQEEYKQLTEFGGSKEVDGDD